MIVLALGRGLSGALRPRLLLSCWLVTVVLALPVAVTHGLLLHESTGHLPDPAGRAEGFQPPYLDDFERQEASGLRTLSDGTGLATWTHVLVMGLLAGGLVASFDTRGRQFREERGERLELSTFFASAARHAGPMLLILAIGIGLHFLVDLLVNTWLADVLSPRFTRVENERVALIVEWGRQGVHLLALLGIASWLDLARAHVVIEQRSWWSGLIAGFRSSLRHPWALLLGMGGLLLAEIVVTWLGARILGTLGTASWTGLIAWFAGAQVLVLLRLVFGLWRLGTLTSLVELDRDEREDLESALPGTLA